MGFFWEGLPPYVLPWASALLGPGVVAIETGTFRGDTSLLLRDHFGECRTIERSAHLASAARQRFVGDSRVHVFEGSSRDLLAGILPDASVPCFLWLDAHGIYDHVGDDQEENPLLEELRIVIEGRRGGETVLAIDDARGMGTQPDWPSVGEISHVLREGGFHVVSFDDVIVATNTTHSPDFYALYRASRMVEVSSVFQVWPHVVRSVRNRMRMDRILGRFTRK